MSKILLLGNDSRLLKTRAQVLSKTGAHLVSSTIHEAAEIISRTKFDVIVVCHTLEEHEAREMMDGVRLIWPGTKILYVTSMYAGAGIGTLRPDAISSSDPTGLIRRTTELLETDAVEPVSL